MKFELTDDANEIIANLLADEPLFAPLQAVGLVVAVLMATGEEGEQLKHGGYACAAYIRKTSTVERVLGMKDAVITLHSDTWDELSDESRIALIAHELYHLKPIEGEDGEFVEKVVDGETVQAWQGTWQTDELGRPKLAMRKHDIQVGWFVPIAKRYGQHSMEVIDARALADKYGQLLFGFVLAGEPTAKKGKGAKSRAA